MRKVLNFVKGKKEERRDAGHPLASPFLEEFQVTSQPERQERTWVNEDSSSNIEQGWGYNIDFSGKDKSVTKLHKAAWQGNLEKLKVNIKKGDIDAADRFNRTPLHLAVARGNANIVWYLLNTKAKLNICDTEGRTPFLKAVECGHKDIIVMMLERGVDLNTIDYSGNSALHIAAKQGYYEITSILLKEGANFESSNNLGESPLHIATQAQHRDLIELLLRYGSSVNAVDRDNRSPLMFAAKNGNMAIVQLFLEYGAQRKVQDSNDWTAEDYAILGGHHDVAAELKSPSEIVALDFDSKVVESKEVCKAIIKRSVSATSLPGEQVDAKNKKKSDDPDSDTWNDSQLSEAVAKPLPSGLKLTKFLPPSSDEEGSDDSGSSNKINDLKEEEMQDSPRSCVIPPPCKPPRSWDLIQSGVIDDPQGSEPRRRSLLTLGSLRSKRESFTDSPSGADTPSQTGASPHKSQSQGDAPSFVRYSEKDNSPVHLSKSLKSDSHDKSEKNKSSSFSKDKLTGDQGDKSKDNSDSDWDSDDSLPLDGFHVKNEAPPVPPLPAEILEQAEASTFMQGIKDNVSEASGSEKRGRFLLRATSIDLTDDDGDFIKEKGASFSAESEEKTGLSEEVILSQSSSNAGTLGRDGTLLGYEEVWEANAQLPATHISGTTTGIGENHPSIQEEEEESGGQVIPKKELKQPFMETWGSLAPPNSKRVIEDSLVYPSPSLDQRTKQMSLGSFEIGEAKNIKYKLESHSLDELGHPVQGPPQNPDIPAFQKKKHSRQQSISVLNWSKSEDLYQKPRATNLERMIADSKRINKQLECYDEALRELAQVTIIKKQHSLPNPSIPDIMDPPVSRYIGPKAQRYLSLPRTNELIDEAFKEIGQTSANMKRTSLSLPRTITPKDMEAAAESVALVKKKKQSTSRRRAESEGETFTSRLRDHINRSLSFDTKLQGSSSSSLPKTPAPLGKSATSGAKSAQIITTAQIDKSSQADKPIRKKRKILLAMRCFRKYERESVSGTSPTEASEEESSEDPPFWISTDKSGALERQSTVIEKVDFRPKSKPDAMRVSPSAMAGSTFISKEDELQIEEEQSEVRDVIVEFHEEGANVTVKEETVTQLHQPLNSENDGKKDRSLKGKDTEEKNINIQQQKSSIEQKIKNDEIVEKVYVQESRKSEESNPKPFGEKLVLEAVQVEIKVDSAEVEMQPADNIIEEKEAELENVTQKQESGNEALKSDSSQLQEVSTDDVHLPIQLPTCLDAKDSTTENVWDTPSPGHHTPISKEGESNAELFGDSVSTSHPSSVSVDHDDQRGLDFHKDSQSEGDSGGSQNDITPQHQVSLKHSHNLLKEHLRAATAERGRLQETAAQLGEQAEKLKYELAEAQEAARSREEVITLLQEQLSQMENKHSQVLEETHRYRLRLGNVEQELRHLHEICSKYEEEKAQLNEIIRLKDQELYDLDRTLAEKDEDKRTALLSEKDKEKTQQELMLHMIYLEQQNNKSSEEIEKLEKKNNELEKKLEDLTAQNVFLSEENSRIFSQSSLEIKNLEEESSRWKDLFESGVKKLSEQLAQPIPCIVTVAAALGAEAGLLTLVDQYQNELKDIVHKFENIKNKINHSLCQESLNGHPDFQEEISEAIQILKCGYSQIEVALSKHEKTLRDLTSKLSERISVSENVNETCGQEDSIKKIHLMKSTPQTQEQNFVLTQQSKLLLDHLKNFEKVESSGLKHDVLKDLESFVQNVLCALQNMNVGCENLSSEVEENHQRKIQPQRKETFGNQRRYSEESGISMYASSVAVIDQLLKENKSLKNQLEDIQSKQNEKSAASEKQLAFDTIVEQNKFLNDDIEAITKLYNETVKKVDKFRNENERLKLDISSLQRELEEMDRMDIVERLKQENRDYKIKNDLLEQELDTYRVSKFSKSSQTSDEEIADIINENESIKSELECVKKQLARLELELSGIAQIKDIKFPNESSMVDEMYLMCQVEKLQDSHSIVSDAFRKFSDVICQLHKENQALKSQLVIQKTDAATHCYPPHQELSSLSGDVDASNNQSGASLYCSRSLDSEEDIGCEILAASVTSDSDKEIDDKEEDKACCKSKSGRENPAAMTSQEACSSNCIPECNVVAENIDNKRDIISDNVLSRDLQSPPSKDDADVVPFSLQYLIDPRNRETEFTCKNTAAHPKEYGLKNGKQSNDSAGCRSCIHSHKGSERNSDKCVSKDNDKGSRKLLKNSEKDCHTVVWNCNVVNGCEQISETDKYKTLLRNRNYTVDNLDVINVSSSTHDFHSEEGCSLADGGYREKPIKEHLQDEEKEKLSLHYAEKSPSKKLSAFTDLSNFPSSFRSFPRYTHGCGSDGMEQRRVPLEMCGRTCTWPSRDAATNTMIGPTSLDLQRELQQEREKGRRNQQSMKKLKAEVQILRNRLGDVKKGGKMDANLVKQGNLSSTTNSCCSGTSGSSRHVLLTSAPVSPLRFDHTLTEFQRRVVELEQKLREENSMRWALELQVNKMKYELKEKLQLEKDLDSLRCQMEKEFVSRYELEQLKRSYEVALQRAKQDAESAVRDDVSTRLHHLNTVIEKQMQEQNRYEQMRNSSDAQIRQDFQDTRLKLLSELSRVQTALQEKGEKELELRQKCDKLSRECDKKHDMRRKKLIEKSYSINLAPYPISKEKDLKGGSLHHLPHPTHTLAQHSVSVPGTISDNWPAGVPINHLLRRELEKSIRKHANSDPGADQASASTSHVSDERLKILKNKYFLH
ncbi:hypothetical protein R5R35_001935 [Gryllus longicercus]|uniref:Uncharacterized protein n=1 Tax=Gryllus longicercus TaxID=2509291 RepID=A0AAN9W7P3_9ORTH